MRQTTVLLAMPALAGVFLFGPPHGVEAYLDPGTGSLIIQVVIGMAVGGLAAVGIFWRRITSFFRDLFSKGDES